MVYGSMMYLNSALFNNGNDNESVEDPLTTKTRFLYPASLEIRAA